MPPLASIITPERVALLPRLGSKKRAFEHLSECLAVPGQGPGVNEIFGCLLERERLGSTGLGHGVALPHGRLETVDRPRAAFLRLLTPIEYDGAADGQPVDMIMALLFPGNGRDEHLAVLATAARMFSDDALCERLRSAATAEGLYQTLVAWRPAADDTVQQAETG